MTMDSVNNVPNSLDEATVEYVAPSFEMHTFVETIDEKNIHFLVMKMDSSLFIWIGLQYDPLFEDLSLAMKTRYNTFPLATKLFGESVEMVSSSFAIKLVKKLEKPVYVSFNVTPDKLILPAIYERLNEEIKMHPDKF